MADYTLSYTRLLSFAGNYTRDFTLSRSSSYSRNFGGNYTRNYTRTRTSTFSRARQTAYAGQYARNFTRDRSSAYTRGRESTYVGEYARNFTRERNTDYTRERDQTFVGYYSRDFTRERNTDFTVDRVVETSVTFFSRGYSRFVTSNAFYSRSYSRTYTAVPYSRTFGASYTRNDVVFTGTSTRQSVFFEPETGENFPITYSRQVDYVGTGYFSRGRESTYTREDRTVGFTRIRTSSFSRFSTYADLSVEPRQSTYTTTYTGNYIGDFIGNYSRNYAGNYTGDFIGNYTGDFIGNYSRNYAGTYSRTFGGNYTRSFEGNYARNYTGTYSRSFAGEYTRNYIAAYAREFTRLRSSSYARNFAGNYVVEYTRTSTRTSSYTRTISGGTGETPTYTPTASNAEYGLVVYGPDGVTEIINPQTRVTNLAFYGSSIVQGNSSSTLTIKDCGDPTKVQIIVDSRASTMSYSTSGDTLTITNSSSYAATFTVIALRLS